MRIDFVCGCFLLILFKEVDNGESGGLACCMRHDAERQRTANGLTIARVRFDREDEGVYEPLTRLYLEALREEERTGSYIGALTLCQASDISY